MNELPLPNYLPLRPNTSSPNHHHAAPLPPLLPLGRGTLGGVQRIGGKARGEVDGEGACTGEVEVEVEQPPSLFGREKENLTNDGDREIRGDQALIFLILGLICFRVSWACVDQISGGWGW